MVEEDATLWNESERVGSTNFGTRKRPHDAMGRTVAAWGTVRAKRISAGTADVYRERQVKEPRISSGRIPSFIFIRR